MVLAALGALVVTQFTASSDPRRDFAAGDKEAILMFPPETVCGSDAARMVWTADGSALVVLRNVVDAAPSDLTAMMASNGRPTPATLARMRPRTELVAWTVATRKARVLLSGDAMRTGVSSIEALPGTNRLVIDSSTTVSPPNEPMQQTQAIALLDPSTGALTTLDTAPVGEWRNFEVSPSKPLGFLGGPGPTPKQRAWRIFTANGRLSPKLVLPAGAQTAFAVDGMPGYILNAAKPGTKPVWQFHRLDPTTGKEGAIQPFVPIKDLDPKDALSIQIVTGRAQGAAAPSLFLVAPGGKPEEAGVVTTDGERGLVSPKGDAVAYRSQGSAMVRLCAHVPRKMFDDARLAALKTVAISNAKQAALAMLMYAGDEDDTYPGQDVDIRSRVSPYIKNDAILSAFNYTYGGGKLTDIEKPAETEIGFVTGPGGRAVAYADGHVKWIPDAP